MNIKYDAIFDHYAFLGTLYYFRFLFRCRSTEKDGHRSPKSALGIAISTSALWVINCLS